MKERSSVQIRSKLRNRIYNRLTNAPSATLPRWFGVFTNKIPHLYPLKKITCMCLYVSPHYFTNRFQATPFIWGPSTQRSSFHSIESRASNTAPDIALRQATAQHGHCCGRPRYNL